MDDLVEMSGWRLRYALDFVREKVRQGGGDLSDFMRVARRLPTLLLNSGLALTIAYLYRQRRSGRESGFLLEYLEGGLKRSGSLRGGGDLLESILRADASRLPEMLDEALDLAVALKLTVEVIYGVEG